MTVRELIDILNTCDENANVLLVWSWICSSMGY